MTFKKVLSLLNVVAGLTFSSHLLAQQSPEEYIGLRIEPMVADVLETQKFDIAVYLPQNVQLPLTRPDFEPVYPSPYPSPALAPQRGSSALKIKAVINQSADVSAWFHECIQEHWVTAVNERVLLCKSLDYSPFVEGINELTITVQQFNDDAHTATAYYRVTKSSRKFHDVIGFYEPKRFVVRGTSFNTASNISVVAGQRVIIKAAGRVNVWPANAGYPLSSPRGTESCGQLCLFPSAYLGALLVKIGPYGRWMVAGESYLLTADRAGELFFAVNDKTALAESSDNLGSYEVSVGRY